MPVMMKNIVLPDIGERSLAFYLAMEDFVAGHVEGDSFFVWRVSPTVILGRNQVVENEVNMDYCRRHGVEVIRRRSGGGCVYSDKGNIMVSYVSTRGAVSEVFDRFLSAMTSCLCSLGLDAEKSGRNDILVGGKKVSGNAFRQMPGRSIVHGTLLYDTDLDALESAIMPPLEKLERHGVASVRQRVINLKPYISTEGIGSVEQLEDYLLRWFCDEEVLLGPEDIRTIERMAIELFESI